MHRRRAFLSLLAVLGAACTPTPPTAMAAKVTGAERTGGPYEQGEAIVRFEVGTSPLDRRDVRQAAGARFDAALGLPRAQVVGVEGSVQGAIRRLERQPGVAYAQPNYRYQALAVLPPDDTFFESLWGLSDPVLPDAGVYALEAWEDNQGEGQVIAVADTGVDLTHPDLIGNLWENPSPDPVDQDLHGYDFVDNDGDPDEYAFHGTHVAGTAAAIVGNSLGVAGVAPKAEIMAIRVLDGDGSGSTADIADGILYAANHGTDVVNLSLGGPAGEDKAMSDAVNFAAGKDVVVVAAAGNSGTDNDVEPTTPCTLPQANLICVAALNKNGALASFSNFGAKSVDLAAPGTAILSAKADYGPRVFSDDFESGLGLWTTEAFDGGVPWGVSPSGAGGSTKSATDSPSGDYGQAPAFEVAESDLFTTAVVDLTGERGCRIHFQTKYEIEPFFDMFAAGAFAGKSVDFVAFDGVSPGYPSSFEREEASISQLDGRSNVHPIFGVLSDASEQFDGAYVDDVRLICRDETYVNAITSVSQYDQPDAGNYVEFNGTSMATPHVSGVAALVGAAAPAASATQVAEAILGGTSALPVVNTAKPTVTFGVADACQAIAVATGGDVATNCPSSTASVVPPPPLAPAPVGATPPTNEPGISPSLDGIAPNTSFLSHPPKIVRTSRRRVKLMFRFGSDESGVSFLCQIDGAAFHACDSRFVRRFKLGRHVVRVRARDAAGNIDDTPAVYRFAVKPRV
jgi:subtilisin family serine protease